MWLDLQKLSDACQWKLKQEIWDILKTDSKRLNFEDQKDETEIILKILASVSKVPEQNMGRYISYK